MNDKEKKPQNKIRELRKEKGISIDKLANVIGVSRATINNYETGLHEPKLETWQKLADYFNVNVSYLMGLNDIKTVPLLNNDEEANPELMKVVNEDALESVQLFNMLLERLNIKDNLPDNLSFKDKEDIGGLINDLFYQMLGQALADNWDLYGELKKLYDSSEEQSGDNWIEDNDKYIYSQLKDDK